MGIVVECLEGFVSYNDGMPDGTGQTISYTTYDENGHSVTKTYPTRWVYPESKMIGEIGRRYPKWHKNYKSHSEQKEEED